VDAASQVNVPNSVTAVYQPLHGLVCYLDAVAQMHIVEILAQSGNGKDCCVGDVTALGKDKIPQPRCRVDNLLNGTVRKAGT